MKKVKPFILIGIGVASISAYFNHARRHSIKPAIVYPLPMKKYKVKNGWIDVDLKLNFKPGEVYYGIQINEQIVTLYKDGKKYYDAVLFDFTGSYALIETNEPVTFNGLGNISNNLI